jgi:hypothetical protein
VLHVDDHEVEAGEREHVDDLGARQLQERAEAGAAPERRAQIG